MCPTWKSDDGSSLIPREVLFGNPVRASPRMSPDGARLAYLAPSEQGVLNVWVRTLGEDDDFQVTAETHRGVRVFFWAKDSRRLLYLQDCGGDENFHLFSTDLDATAVRDLTPFEGVKVENLLIDKHYPNELLIGLNARDRQVFDMHRLDLTTGALVLDTENPGDVVEWFADAEFVVRGALATNPEDGGSELRVRDAKDAPWRPLITWPFGDEGTLVTFTRDGRAVYVTTTLGGDTTRLVKVDAVTGEELEILACHSKCDVDGTLVDPDTHEIQAVRFNYLRPEWRVLDPSIRADFEALSGVAPGDFGIVSRDERDTTWVVVYIRDDGPVSWHCFERASKTARFLFVNQPALDNSPLARMQPLVITARDGFELVSFLTLPLVEPPRNLPLVLLVHGGPWSRDEWGFDGQAQWLANRGYAVLQVNFRGSAGFGKRFLNAGNNEWGVGAMQHDLTDAVRWAIEQGVADPGRVCIMGGSYGGYATLAGLAFTPDLYACGVDIVGPSHIRTLLESIPPYWAPLKKQFQMRVGDAENDEALDRKLSPLFHADKIKAPLLIAQGANDPRVNIRESDQIVEAMRTRGLPVTYVVYTDEGHGMARPANRLDFYGRVEEFLSGVLGGRVEPWTPMPGAAVEVR